MQQKKLARNGELLYFPPAPPGWQICNMPAAPDCLTPLLGLSKGTTNCFPLPEETVAGQNAYITDSATGLYLDAVEGLSLKAAAGASPATDIWTKLASARENAAFQVRAALEAGRAKSYGTPLYSQRGVLGGLGNGQLAPLGTKAEMTLYTNARREGAWRITRIQLFTDQAVTDVPLLLDGEEVARITTSATASSSVLTSPDALLIPLDGNPHTLQAVLPEGVRVKSNNLFSGCFSCSRNSPWFKSVQGSLQNVTAHTPGNGFSISVQEECIVDPDFLCYAVGVQGSSFRFPEIARYVGIALRYKAAELFTIDLLAGKDSNRYTMLEPKSLNALGSMYEKKAAEYIGWLNSPEGLGQVRHPCFVGPVTAAPGMIWTG